VFNAAAIWKNLNSPRRLFLIAGPCVIENEKLCLQVAARSRKPAPRSAFFTSSRPASTRPTARRANRFAAGLDGGLKILGKVRAEFGVPVLTDVHNEAQAAAAGEVVDILQIPAFLCRQTDLIEAAVATGKIVNLKKGPVPFAAEMARVAEKARRAGGKKNPAHRARHDVRLQQPRGRHALDSHHEVVRLSGGVRRDAFRAIARRRRRQIVRPARICAGAGARGAGGRRQRHCSSKRIRTPDKALSDGPNMIPLAEMSALLRGC
jgi:2-dehydro-3-deoxyphosphooctonate aldolase (KDO 8-P synthase)